MKLGKTTPSEEYSEIDAVRTASTTGRTEIDGNFSNLTSLVKINNGTSVA